MLAYLKRRIRGKNGFVEVSKNLEESENNFVRLSIYVERLNIDVAKSFNVLATTLNVLHNSLTSFKIIFGSVSK